MSRILTGCTVTNYINNWEVKLNKKKLISKFGICLENEDLYFHYSHLEFDSQSTNPFKKLSLGKSNF